MISKMSTKGDVIRRNTADAKRKTVERAVETFKQREVCLESNRMRDKHSRAAETKIKRNKNNYLIVLLNSLVSSEMTPHTISLIFVLPLMLIRNLDSRNCATEQDLLLKSYRRI